MMNSKGVIQGTGRGQNSRKIQSPSKGQNPKKGGTIIGTINPRATEHSSEKEKTDDFMEVKGYDGWGGGLTSDWLTIGG